MTTIDFGHTFIAGDTAATVTVSGVAEITSLDMSSLTKVKTVNIQDNGKLASISCSFIYNLGRTYCRYFCNIKQEMQVDRWLYSGYRRC